MPVYACGFNGFNQIVHDSHTMREGVTCPEILTFHKSKDCFHVLWKEPHHLLYDSGSDSSGEPKPKKSKASPKDYCDNLKHVAISWDRLYFLYEHDMVVKGRADSTLDQSSTVTECSLFRGKPPLVVVSSGWTDLYGVHSDGSSAVWIDHFFGDPSSRIPISSQIKCQSICAGGKYTIAQTDDMCCGTVELFDNPKCFVYKPITLKCKIKRVSCGKEHVLLLSQIGIVLSFGIGGQGQLGHATVENQTDPQVIEQLEGCLMVDIAAGGWHSVALSDIGDLYVWGWNERGQLGFPSKIVREDERKRRQASRIQELSSHSDNHEPSADEYINIQATPCVLDITKDDTDDVRIEKISCGSRHTAALSDSSAVYTWGWNDYGQLGHGDTHCRDCPTEVSFFSNRQETVIDILCGYWNTVFQTTQDSL